MFSCPNGCDDDDRESEKYHCSINTNTGQFHCFKCDIKGNLITLKKLLGINSIERRNFMSKNITRVESQKMLSQSENKLMKQATKAHEKLMKDSDLCNKIMEERGLSTDDLNNRLIGRDEFYGKKWITIPIVEGSDCKMIKLRRMFDETEGPKYMVYPKNCGSTVFGITELRKSRSGSVLICGGELDKIAGDKMGFEMPVITSTAGEGTFKDGWINSFLEGRRKIYLCFDNDEKGRQSTIEIGERIASKLTGVGVYSVPIPEELGDKADLTDAFKAGYTAEQLLSKATLIAGEEPIDASSFGEMTLDDLIKILSLTIKYDDMNKAILLLAMLSTYTEEDQLNVFLNAKSSSGKTYLVTEVAKLFPKIDVKKYARVSPTAFYYDLDTMELDTNGEMMLNLERKILIFLDQVDTRLQEMLRTFLSHDDKKLPFMITNRNKSGMNSASKGYLLGFSSTFFCSANMKMDEQEYTRAILLSPEISQEKIEASIDLIQESSGNTTTFNSVVAKDARRQNLISRINYIREMNIQHIIIPEHLNVGKRFKEALPNQRRARNQRDAKQFIAFIKMHALLNAMHRERSGNDIIAKEQDVQAGLKIWGYLGRSQFYGVPPQTLDFYDQYIVPAFRLKNSSDKTANGISPRELGLYYQKMTGEILNQDILRKQHIPVLQDVGLISYEKDNDDRRQRLIVPLVFTDNRPNALEGDK